MNVAYALANLGGSGGYSTTSGATGNAATNAPNNALGGASGTVTKGNTSGLTGGGQTAAQQIASSQSYAPSTSVVYGYESNSGGLAASTDPVAVNAYGGVYDSTTGTLLAGTPSAGGAAGLGGGTTAASASLSPLLLLGAGAALIAAVYLYGK